MSTRLIAADVDPEEGVMSQMDFTYYYADTLDCLVSFFSLPSIEAHVRYDLVLVLCTIRSGHVLVYNMIWPHSGVRYQSQSHAYYDTQY